MCICPVVNKFAEEFDKIFHKNFVNIFIILFYYQFNALKRGRTFMLFTQI